MPHQAYNFRWSSICAMEYQRVVAGVRKNLDGHIVADNLTDLYDHSDIIILDICEMNPQEQKGRKTRSLNFYTGIIGRGYTWVGKKK